MAATIKLRRDLAANWTSADPTLASGEVGVETDTNKLKIGTGVAAWTILPYFADAASLSQDIVDALNGASVPDGSNVFATMADIGGGGTWGSITGTLSSQTDLQSALNLKATIASPTFTGTVAFPTPFTLGGVSVTATGTELNFVDGVTSAIQTQLDAKQATITFGTGVQTALGVNIGSAGAPVLFNGAGGTPSSITLTNGTGLPIGGLTGLGTGVGTALAINVGSAGAFVTFNGALGTPSSGTLTNATGLPITAGTTGTLGFARGGTGLTTLGTDGQQLRVNTGATALEYFTSSSMTVPQVMAITFIKV